jgi:hypothetical protein
MRVCVMVALAFVLSACGSDKNGNGNDLAMTSSDDLSAGGSGGGGGGGGGPSDGGYSTDAGGAGAGCMTACDCMPGLGCFNQHCVVTNNPIYCCGATPCPNGAFCEHSGGGFGRCGMTGTPDLANFDHCPFIDCSNGNGMQRCINAGCAMCVTNQNGMVCSR